MVKRRTVKTIFYRISTIIIVQISAWILFQNWIINFAVGILELVRMSWYYIYDYLFEEKVWKEIRFPLFTGSTLTLPVIEAYPQTSYVRLSTVDSQGRLLCKCPECGSNFTKKADE